MKHFDRRVAAITGAGSGIGRSLALELAGRGCPLALCDIDESAVRTVADEVRELGVRCTIHRVDVADRHQVERFAHDTVETHGCVHMIFNNAGVALGDFVETMTYEDFEWLMQINFWGVVYGTKAFLPYLKQVDEAHIINISSLFGLGAVPTQSAYNAAKFAVRGFTEALKMELSPTHVRVSCVHPGGIRTNIVNSARLNEAHVNLTRSEMVSRFDRLARTTPDKAARTILKGVSRNRRRIIVGADAWIIDKIIRLFPAAYERILRLEVPVKKLHKAQPD